MPGAKLDLKNLDNLIRRALAEDVGPGDVTTAALIDPKLTGGGRLVAREGGVLAGMPVIRRLLRTFDRRLRLWGALADEARLKKNTVIATLRGPVASMLTVERTLLNFLQRLSGIATLTRRYVDAVAGTGVKILDTRKTLPGWRGLSKYAVTVGGGINHRMGLYDQVLIKDNHLRALRELQALPEQAVAMAKARLKRRRKIRFEVEVETVDDAEGAARSGADIVMLDNMPPARMKEAVKAIRALSRRTIIEASGRISLKNVRVVARTGVDWISIGAITHSAGALDISLDMETR